MPKGRLSEKRTEPFNNPSPIAAIGERGLRPEIHEAYLRSGHEIRLAELKRQYRNGTYSVPASEISASLIEKHLKR